MRTALDSVELDPALDAQLWDYLVMAAHSLVNVVPENRRVLRGAATWGSRRRSFSGFPACFGLQLRPKYAAGVVPVSRRKAAMNALGVW